MKERYDIIRKRFKQIINEKNNLKEKRNHSFIESNNNSIKKELGNKNSFNLTKNSFYKKEKFKKNLVLNQKYYILKKSLDKLQLILEKNINEENIYKNDIIGNIHNIKSYYMNELTKDTISLQNDLQSIKNEFLEEIKIRESNKDDINNEVNNLVNSFTNNNNIEINCPKNKINLYRNNQQNYFSNINKEIKQQIREVNLSCNNDIQYSNQKYEIIMNDISSFNNKIRILDKEEAVNREKFKEEITYILNCEIDNFKSTEMINSIELIKTGKKPY